MSYHARTSILIHCVFSTKNRLALIPSVLQPRLWSYIGGVARTNRMKALAVGGIADHCHVLVSLPPTMALAKAVQLVKAGSSKWMRDIGRRNFAWQEGYGGFSIGAFPRLQPPSNIFPTRHSIMPKSVFRRNGRSFWKNMACHYRMTDQPSLAGLPSITHANPAVPAGLFSFAPVGA